MLTERPEPRDAYEPEAFAQALARCRRSGVADPMILDLADALFGVQRALYDDPGLLERDKVARRDWLRHALPPVVRAVTANSPSAPEELRALADLLNDTNLDAGIAAAAGDGGALARLASETGTDAPVLYFVLRNAMQPYHSRTCPPPENPSAAHPARQVCPSCGGRPLMARHAQPDGHRFLGCAVCGREWAYPRVACPACGETDHDRLEVIYVPGNKGHRLYLCSTCMRYTKAADERLLGGPAYLPLEDLVTLHLDELARQRGFVPVNETALSQAAERKRFH